MKWSPSGKPSASLPKMRLSLLFVIAPVAALSALAFGCSVTAPSASSGAQQITIHYEDAGDAAVTVAEAGGDAAQTPTQGSRLCLQGPIPACDPDTMTTASLCVEAPDGGAWDPNAGYGDAGLACRVTPAQSLASDGGPTAACSPAGAGTDGTACTYSSDCAAGFDCVGTPGACRHYCCAGNSVCGKDQFCDTQSLAVATTTQVPVCMPITPAGGCVLESCIGTTCPVCPTGETCSVVRDDGATGCVQTGSALVGGACDVEHCFRGLVCLGSASAAANTPGARLCYALCLTASPSSCASPATCQGGLPLFQDPAVGVCR